MLFYQRSSEVAVQQQKLQVSGMASPLRLPVPERRSNHIAMENELFMRKYCLYDPSHATFVTKILSNAKHLNGGRCSAEHTVEKLALRAALNHLDQVIARTKDLPDFPTFMVTLRQMCHGCAECSRDYIEWYCEYPEALRMLLLRNPDALVRNEIAASIVAALNKVRTDAPYAYGFGEDDDSIDELDGGDPQLIQSFIKACNSLWDVFHSNTRAWPEYFGLLASIAKMGKRESVLLLDHRYLERTLSIVSADQALNLDAQYTRMLNIVSKRMGTRPVSYEAVITLLYLLLEICDPSLKEIDDDDLRIDLGMNGMPIPITVSERNLVQQFWTRTESSILMEKLLFINQNSQATEAIIIGFLTGHWPADMHLDGHIQQAILHGARNKMTPAACAPYLRAALIYCEHSENTRAFQSMVSHVAKIASRADAEGKEFLQFFKNVSQIHTPHNEMSKEESHKFFLEQVSIWAPCLLTYYDGFVRGGTEDFLHELIFKHDIRDEDDEESEEMQVQWAKVEYAARKLGFSCLEYLHETYIRPRVQAIRVQTVNILTVIENCVSFFDYERKDANSRKFRDLHHCK